ncbi:MAG TPA: NAD(P)-dependent oxidoreductase [Bacteroidia bacterium]|jgi:citronellol/citronellal dehydrogenase|nr:NAD(P)-dependent oxidoreductase [Bacteroidia bacterium]
MNFKDKTIFITGGSRGIGKAIALKLAADGANIVIAAKTTEVQPKLEGTIFSAAEEIEKAGGKCLPVKCDIRNEEEVVAAVNAAVEKFGGIDILVNNASAINLSPVSILPAKQYDLMMDINTRGTYLVSRHCIPYLKKSSCAHILTLSPPISIKKEWFSHFAPYTISKFGMSMLTMGMAEELKKDNICVNSLWPHTTIATAAVKNILGGDELMKKSRKPEILADTAYFIFQSRETGNFFLDEEVLAKNGITDLSKYAVTPGGELMKDLFL